MTWVDVAKQAAFGLVFTLAMYASVLFGVAISAGWTP